MVPIGTCEWCLNTGCSNCALVVARDRNDQVILEGRNGTHRVDVNVFLKESDPTVPSADGGAAPLFGMAS